MKLNHVIKINCTGGIITPKKLKSIAEIAQKFDAKVINFGPRQEIFFNVSKENLYVSEALFAENRLDFELDAEVFPNIMSAIASKSIFSSDTWVTEGIYKDVLAQFDFKPQLKINLTETDQNLIPLFSGQLNFIASPNTHYWFLYFKLKDENTFLKWPKLIYSTDIAKVAKSIENQLLTNSQTDLEELVNLVEQESSYLSLPTTNEIELKRYVFPYYEGMNRYGNKYWLGIYRRDFHFPIPLIIELCNLCESLTINQISLSSFRTLLIKGIEQEQRIYFERLLGKYGINLRHSSNELNWIISDINNRELSLKQYIMRKFDKDDIRTFGIIFGIDFGNNQSISASAIIEFNPYLKIKGLDFWGSYSIYYRENFNPNSPKKILFAEKIPKPLLFEQLKKLCKFYYTQLSDSTADVPVKEKVEKKPESKTLVYQCKNCLNVYFEKLGDSTQQIKPNTLFSQLPKDYCCPICETPKAEFLALPQNEIYAH